MHFFQQFRGTLLVCLVLSTSSTGTFAQPVPKPTTLALPQTAAQWREAAIRDIQAGYTITLRNHPGTYDRANPGFVKNLLAAKQDGLQLAAKVHNGAGYTAAIEAFNVRIHDGHAGMVTKLDPSALPPERWPGFVTVWRGEALHVAAAEPGQLPIGAKLVSCDGVPMTTLITQNVFTFMGRVDEPGHWWTMAREVFVDRGNPFIALPQLCEYEVDGKTNTQQLTWVPRTDQAKQWYYATSYGDELAVGITEPRARLYWVAMPTFQPDDKQREAYRAMTDEVQQQRQRFLDADAIVIDLRHNLGGSSMWSQEFAGALWGKGRVQRRLQAYSAKTEVWWRASKDNTAHVENLVKTLTQQKQTEAAHWVKGWAAGMRKALNSGQKFFVAERAATVANPADSMGDVAGDPAAFTQPVYVVVPGQCASACLDALDVFTRFPNTKLIGAPSSADSTYMEVRHQTLASGRAVVVVPNKVYVNRPRANGQVYKPEIYVNDLDWSTANFLAVVERDLLRSRK